MKKKAKYGINSGNTLHFGALRKATRMYARHKHVIVKSIKHTVTDFLGGSLQDTNRKIERECAWFVDDGGLEHIEPDRGWRFTPQDVEYTMNKRKRWLLPRLIKEAIDQVKEARTADRGLDPGKKAGEGRGGDDSVSRKYVGGFHMAMVERVSPPFDERTTPLPHSCTGYHDSRQPIVHVKPHSSRSYETDLKVKAEDRENEKYRKSERARRARIRHYQESEDEEHETGNEIPNWVMKYVLKPLIGY